MEGACGNGKLSTWTFESFAKGPHASDLFERFFRCSVDMMCLADERGYFVVVNSAFIRVLDYTEGELTARPFLDFVHPDDRAKTLEMHENILDEEPCFGFENRYRHRDGTYRWFQWSSILFPDQGLCFASARDITEQKKLQALQATQEKMQALSTLASGIGHDFNTILASIVGLADLASLEVDDAEAVQQKLQMIGRAAERGVKLVSKLFHPSFESEESPAWLSVDVLLREVLEMAESKYRGRVSVARALGASSALVYANSCDLHQIFLNLAMNAFRAAADGGGHVCVASRWDARAGRLTVAIDDDGPGIPSSIRHRIFEPYFTTQAASGGRGIGLWMVHALTSRLGAEVRFDSDEGRGTRFEFACAAKMADPLRLS